ncbi:protein of unknown function [Taphrina deformans PYCC 5710]|uniref:Uncharacterized protein n=1 Tax=Taphrina deformans (strain PYCC 5710 / ATCC 11124 / CBS 356.35 / IMI 108563 / JCM 9778 / NBRC 8474) TaxID=1097556 RepID=R4XCA6_TAPDE|nr:protein of unknown function [Taphrina deformans PYCC 5710]|eukprot:CCG80960.1 protein of unknown function [Taphrina deformans PYCC 5710]
MEILDPTLKTDQPIHAQKEQPSTVDTCPIDLSYTQYSDDNIYDIEGINEVQEQMMQIEEIHGQHTTQLHDSTGTLDASEQVNESSGARQNQDSWTELGPDCEVTDDRREMSVHADDHSNPRQDDGQSTSMQQGHHKSDTSFCSASSHANVDLDFERQELALEINALLSDVISERQYRRSALEAAAGPLVTQKRKLLRREAALAKLGAQVREQGQRLMQGFQ